MKVEWVDFFSLNIQWFPINGRAIPDKLLFTKGVKILLSKYLKGIQSNV
jgi:hypothetical protein